MSADLAYLSEVIDAILARLDAIETALAALENGETGRTEKPSQTAEVTA